MLAELTVYFCLPIGGLPMNSPSADDGRGSPIYRCPLGLPRLIGRRGMERPNDIRPALDMLSLTPDLSPEHGGGMPVTSKRGLVPFDVTTPNVARIYDYYLGGKDNYAADREAGDKVLAADPQVRPTLLANRSFLGRVVRYLAGEAGINQFIDLGAGLPTQQNVHEVARAANPDARVVYVDYDPVVLTHAEALLAKDDATTVIPSDLRRPAEVLSHPGLREMIDITQPVAVLMFAVLHFIGRDEGAERIIAGYRDVIAPGSYLALSLGTTDDVDPAKITRMQEVYRNATAQLTYRSRAEIMRLFEGFELIDPGLVRLPQWRPVSQLAERREHAGAEWMFGGIGRKPAAPRASAT
jgi:O-methyltransferase involved in polyketide biosynthesis